MPRRFKGQFFLIGALSLCVLFFIALPPSATRQQQSDIEGVAENLWSEIPRGLNLAVSEGDPLLLREFMSLVRNGISDKYASAEVFWVLIMPTEDSPGDFEYYAGNWLGRDIGARIVLDSETRDISLDDESTASGSITGVSDNPMLQVYSGDHFWSGGISGGKANLYIYVSISRGQDSVVREALV